MEKVIIEQGKCHIYENAYAFRETTNIKSG